MEASDREGLQRVEAWLSTLMIAHTWRSGVRCAIRVASQLSERGPTDVYVGPVLAH